MAANNFSNYMRTITPVRGDPTYSLLKAHLLFEELLRAYLATVLPHHQALEGARLTFVQLLAVARSASTHVLPDNWIWKGIGDLNKLRNMLSHEAQPKSMAEKIDAYIRLIVENTQNPLPQAAKGDGPPQQGTYSAVDIVTIALYYHAASLLGFYMGDVGGPYDKDLSEGM